MQIAEVSCSAQTNAANIIQKLVQVRSAWKCGWLVGITLTAQSGHPSPIITLPHIQVCGKPVTTNSGKSLRPPDNARIILYLKDVNLPRPDKYQVRPSFPTPR